MRGAARKTTLIALAICAQTRQDTRCKESNAMAGLLERNSSGRCDQGRQAIMYLRQETMEVGAQLIETIMLRQSIHCASISTVLYRYAAEPVLRWHCKTDVSSTQGISQLVGCSYCKSNRINFTVKCSSMFRKQTQNPRKTIHNEISQL